MAKILPRKTQKNERNSIFWSFGQLAFRFRTKINDNLLGTAFTSSKLFIGNMVGVIQPVHRVETEFDYCEKLIAVSGISDFQDPKIRHEISNGSIQIAFTRRKRLVAILVAVIQLIVTANKRLWILRKFTVSNKTFKSGEMPRWESDAMTEALDINFDVSWYRSWRRKIKLAVLEIREFENQLQLILMALFTFLGQSWFQCNFHISVFQ